MKKKILLSCCLGLMFTAIAQKEEAKKETAKNLKYKEEKTAASENKSPGLENTLLWKISGNGLSRPSYLFGTMHLLCSTDAKLSDSLKSIIKETDLIYFEIDMDNMMEMLGAIRYLKMSGDKKLSDLLSPDEYKKVKEYFSQSRLPIPFAMMESFKPFFLSSLISEQKMDCAEKQGMEQAIIAESKQYNKEIKGLESVAFQASVFDSIPYAEQAKELLKAIDSAGKNGDLSEELVDVYKKQDLKKIEELTSKDESGFMGYIDLLLYNRNADWAQKMDAIMKSKGALFAVGAAHLPGEKGVINLLRKQGFTVKPIANNLSRTL
jgi:hypothetical protein